MADIKTTLIGLFLIAQLAREVHKSYIPVLNNIDSNEKRLNQTEKLTRSVRTCAKQISPRTSLLNYIVYIYYTVSQSSFLYILFACDNLVKLKVIVIFPLKEHS